MHILSLHLHLGSSKTPYKTLKLSPICISCGIRNLRKGQRMVKTNRLKQKERENRSEREREREVELNLKHDKPE